MDTSTAATSSGASSGEAASADSGTPLTLPLNDFVKLRDLKGAAERNGQGNGRIQSQPKPPATELPRPSHRAFAHVAPHVLIAPPH